MKVFELARFPVEVVVASALRPQDVYLRYAFKSLNQNWIRPPELGARAICDNSDCYSNVPGIPASFRAVLDRGHAIKLSTQQRNDVELPMLHVRTESLHGI